MSSAPISIKSPGHRHSASGDTNKFEEALHARGGISSDTVYGDDYYARHPNSWAKFRLELKF
jgi:hypothetical protein